MLGYQKLAEKATEVINHKKAKTLIINLSYCERLFSSSLGMIGFVIMTFKKNGGNVFVVAKKDIVVKSLSLLGLNNSCTIVEDIDQLLNNKEVV